MTKHFTNTGNPIDFPKDYDLVDELYAAARYKAGACKNFATTNRDLYKEFTKLIIQDAIEAIQDWKNEPFPFDEDTAVWILKQRFGIKSE